jgi:hypothetical protein
LQIELSASARRWKNVISFLPQPIFCHNTTESHEKEIYQGKTDGIKPVQQPHVDVEMVGKGRGGMNHLYQVFDSLQSIFLVVGNVSV